MYTFKFNLSSYHDIGLNKIRDQIIPHDRTCTTNKQVLLEQTHSGRDPHQPRLLAFACYYYNTAPTVLKILL